MGSLLELYTVYHQCAIAVLILMSKRLSGPCASIMCVTIGLSGAAQIGTVSLLALAFPNSLGSDTPRDIFLGILR